MTALETSRPMPWIQGKEIACAKRRAPQSGDPVRDFLAASCRGYAWIWALLAEPSSASGGENGKPRACHSGGSRAGNASWLESYFEMADQLVTQPKFADDAQNHSSSPTSGWLLPLVTCEPTSGNAAGVAAPTPSSPATGSER